MRATYPILIRLRFRRHIVEALVAFFPRCHSDKLFRLLSHFCFLSDSIISIFGYAFLLLGINDRLLIDRLRGCGLGEVHWLGFWSRFIA